MDRSFWVTLRNMTAHQIFYTSHAAASVVVHKTARGASEVEPRIRGENLGILNREKSHNRNVHLDVEVPFFHSQLGPFPRSEFFFPTSSRNFLLSADKGREAARALIT